MKITAFFFLTELLLGMNYILLFSILFVGAFAGSLRGALWAEKQHGLLYSGQRGGGGIYADHHEETQIAPAPVLIFTFPEDLLIALLVSSRRDGGSEVKELVVTLGVRIAIHQVHIGLRIVLVHRVVPVHCIDTAHESAIDEWQFPVFAIVDLSSAGDHQCEPEGTLRIGTPGAPVFWCLELLGLIYDTIHVQADWDAFCRCQTVCCYQ